MVTCLWRVPEVRARCAGEVNPRNIVAIIRTVHDVDFAEADADEVTFVDRAIDEMHLILGRVFDGWRRGGCWSESDPGNVIACVRAGSQRADVGIADLDRSLAHLTVAQDQDVIAARRWRRS